MIVVDASAAVDALTETPGGDALRARLAGEQLHAPELIDYEFVAALRGLIARGGLSPERADAALTDFGDLPLRRWPAADPLRRRALGLRDNLSASDAAYVALAEALQCPLISRDGRLARSTGHRALVIVL